MVNLDSYKPYKQELFAVFNEFFRSIMRSWDQKEWDLLLYTNLCNCPCLFTWDTFLDFSQRISLLNPGRGEVDVILPNWQKRLSGVKACAQVHTPCVISVRAESLMFEPRSWAFPIDSHAWEGLGLLEGNLRRTGAQAASSPRGLGCAPGWRFPARVQGSL